MRCWGDNYVGGLALDEADGYTEPQDGTGRPFNFTLLDYLIRYREPRPTYGS